MCNLTHDNVSHNVKRVEIESIRHKALRRFVEAGNPKGLDAKVVERLRNMIAYLVAIEAAE